MALFVDQSIGQSEKSRRNQLTVHLKSETDRFSQVWNSGSSFSVEFYYPLGSSISQGHS